MARKALERIRKGQKKPASAGFCFSAPRPGGAGWLDQEAVSMEEGASPIA